MGAGDHNTYLSLRTHARRVLQPLLPLIRALLRWPSRARARLAAANIRLAAGEPRLAYLTRDFPKTPNRPIVSGGAVKLLYLQERFPHNPNSCNLLYAVSSSCHPESPAIVELIRRKGISLILNQNGVYYPGWYGKGWEKQNLGFIKLQSMASFVVFQSQFCKVAADKFLGLPPCPSEVIHNPVDLDLFHPPKRNPTDLRLLTIWSASHPDYRIEAALHAFSAIKREIPGARLIVAGFDSASLRDLIIRRKITAMLPALQIADEDLVSLPRFSRLSAPNVFSSAHILLHPQYQDASPGAVVEAMACGLPVAYSATGGTPELVRDAGIGVPGPLDWERAHPPSPAQLALAVLDLWKSYRNFSELARNRAEQHFGARNFVERHSSIFEEVLANAR